jgi:hypothetical protein
MESFLGDSLITTPIVYPTSRSSIQTAPNRPVLSPVKPPESHIRPRIGISGKTPQKPVKQAGREVHVPGNRGLKSTRIAIFGVTRGTRSHMWIKIGLAFWINFELAKTNSLPVPKTPHP